MLKPKAKYQRYLEADCWKMTRREALQRASYLCERCHMARATQVHHNGYASVGVERPEDLKAVCDACHRKLHGLVEVPKAANDNQQIELPMFPWSRLPPDAVERDGSIVPPVKNKPSEGNGRGSAPAVPAVAVHHGQPIGKDVDPREAPLVQQVRAPDAFEERQPQQDNHQGRTLQAGRDELLGKPERRVSNNGIGFANKLDRWLKEVAD